MPQIIQSIHTAHTSAATEIVKAILSELKTTIAEVPHSNVQNAPVTQPSLFQHQEISPIISHISSDPVTSQLLPRSNSPPPLSTVQDDHLEELYLDADNPPPPTKTVHATQFSTTLSTTTPVQYVPFIIVLSQILSMFDNSKTAPELPQQPMYPLLLPTSQEANFRNVHMNASRRSIPVDTSLPQPLLTQYVHFKL